MKVLYVITARGHGKGGHFHSLNHISEAIGNQVKIGICSYGSGRSRIIENNSHFLNHIHFNGKNIMALRREWKNLISQFAPECIHFFDSDAYNMFTILFNANRFNLFLSKCGGPNPKSFPLAQNLILFSEENQKWFQDLSKFKKTNIKLIPNRVNPATLSFSDQRPLQKKDAFCFVRIARIGQVYKKSIQDSIRLIKFLHTKEIKVHLYIIGTIQDDTIANQFKKEIVGLPISMINDDNYTAKASDMLYLADAVIATGRGVMEATFLEKPILTPSTNSHIPVLVDECNFKTFLSTNFSERNNAPDESIEGNNSKILNLIQSAEFYKEKSKLSKNYFVKYFSTESGAQKYIEFYKNYSDSKTIKINRLTDLTLKLKSWALFLMKNIWKS